MELNKLEKTLKQKLWDKGKYFIPFYGGMKAAQEGKVKTSCANTLCTLALTVPLILYAFDVFTTEETKARWRQNLIDERTERKSYAMDKGKAEDYENEIAMLMGTLVMAGSYARYRVYKKHFSKSKKLENEVEKN